MRIIHIKSAGLLADNARKRLEEVFYPDVNAAVADLKLNFPNHVVSSADGYLRVTNKDQSVTVALFKDDAAEQNLVETNFGLRSTKG